MPRALLVTSFPTHTGGAYSHMRSLQAGLQRAGWETALVTNDVRPSLRDIGSSVLASRGSVERARITYKARSLRAFASRLRARLAEHWDIVHCHDALAAGCISPSAAMVLTVHGPASREARMTFPRYREYERFVRELELAAFNRADRIIAVDSGQRDIIRDDFQVASQKVDVIFNAVDTELFRPSMAQRGDYALVPRRLVPKNGVGVAIAAMSHLRGTPLRLVIAGDGPERAVLERQVDELRLRTAVSFLGNVSSRDLLPLIQRSVAVLVPSVPHTGIVEASSIAALEAMSCSRPLIASAIGGLAEMVRHLETGLLVPPGQPAALATAIERVNADQSLAARIGAAARGYVVEKHSLSIWTEQTLATYRKASMNSANRVA